MKAIEKPQIIITTSLLFLLALIFLMLSVSGCINDRVDGNGDVIVQSRATQPFGEVVLEGSFYVKIIPSAETRIEVKGESNIIPHLVTYCDGTKLSLKFQEGVKIKEQYPVEVFVYTPVLHSVKLPGSGWIDCDNFITNTVYLNVSGSGNIVGRFESEKMEAEISGSGDIDLIGKATTGIFSISGSGNISTSNFPVQYCTAYSSGSGNMFLYVSKTLDVTISGSGNITYLLNPVVTSKITGSGKLIKL